MQTCGDRDIATNGEAEREMERETDRETEEDRERGCLPPPFLSLFFLAAGRDEEILQELCSAEGDDILGFSPRLCSTQLLQQQQLLLQHKLIALQQKAVELAELLQQQQQQQQQPQKKQKQQGDNQVLHALQQQISNSQQTYGRLAPLYLIISSELHQARNSNEP